MTFLLDFSGFFTKKSIKRCIHKRVFQTAKAIDSDVFVTGVAGKP